MIIVKKFGGSSLKNNESRSLVINKIEEDIKKNNKVAVVVSAIGRYPDSYSTDALIKFYKDSINEKEIENNDNLKKYLDLIMSYGENISSIIIASLLEQKGYKTKIFNAQNLGIITDNKFNNASVISLDNNEINKYLEKNIIPVITGFQGQTIYKEVTTLGRGGSDLTGIIVGKMINADLIEIYTDVDGVMDSDPKINPNAKKYEKLSFDELINIAENGGKVMHDKAACFAKKIKIPLIIKNTFSNDEGTKIK